MYFFVVRPGIHPDFWQVSLQDTEYDLHIVRPEDSS